MEKKDVVVVGASCAGLFLASLLGREGIPVSVFDQRRSIDSTFRSLIVTDEIRRVLGFDPTEAITHQVRHIQLFSHGISVRITLKQPDFIIERARLLRLLAEKAESSGVQIHYESPFQGFINGSEELRLFFGEDGKNRKRIVRASLLVGADGVRGRVAHSLNENGTRGVWIAQARVPFPGWIGRDTVAVWFDRKLTRFFYWLFPESDGSGVMGIIAEDPREAQMKLDQLLKSYGLDPIEYQSGQVPLYHPGVRTTWTFGKGRVILMGDTAGQVKVTTMGGVMPGLKAAKAVAQSYLNKTTYEKELSSLKRELALHHFLRGLLNRFEDGDYDRLLRLLSEEAKEVLAVWNRDRIGQSLWRVLKAQPLYFLLTVKFLPSLLRKGLSYPQDSGG